MPSYRVCFINEIPRNRQLFRCCQRTIVIRAARTRERAIEAAKKRFARSEHIRDWTLHAAFIEVEALDSEPGAGETSAGDSARGRQSRQRGRTGSGGGARRLGEGNRPGRLRREELGPEQRAELGDRAEAARSRGKPPSI
jgi:hypothetical protein